VRFEVLLPETQHFLQPRIVGANRRFTRRVVELRLQHGRDRVAAVAQLRREAVVREAAVALLGHEPCLFEQAEMPRHAGLCQPEDAGELGHVQALPGEDAQQTQTRLVPEQPVERRCSLHIYESTFIDLYRQSISASRP
jgi:hypothetical protein